MVERFVQQSTLKQSLYLTPQHITTFGMIFGQSGGGKTCFTMAFAQKMHDAYGYKIFDLDAGLRSQENLFWALPSINYKYWENHKKVLSYKEEGPKQYRVNLLYPMMKLRLRAKLPSYQEYDEKNFVVKSTPFTIAIKDIEVEDIACCIGPVNNDEIALWKSIKEEFNNKHNGADLLQLFLDKKETGSRIYKNFVEPLVAQRFLQSKDCPNNINLEAEMNDKETISVLAMDMVESEYKFFIQAWLLRKMRELIEKSKIGTRNILPMREISGIFKVAVASYVHDRVNVFKIFLSNYFKAYARSGIHLIGDTQSYKETNGAVEGQQSMTVISRTFGKGDRDAIIELFGPQLTTDHKNQLQFLKNGEYLFIFGSKQAQKVYFFLPRTMYWEENSGEFYEHVWKKYRDTWKETIPIIISLDKAHAESLEKIQNDAYFAENEKAKKEAELKDKLKQDEFEKRKATRIQNKLADMAGDDELRRMTPSKKAKLETRYKPSQKPDVREEEVEIESPQDINNPSVNPDMEEFL